MSKPLFSVIIPSLNRAHTIGRAIESCLNQSISDFEIIVVDDEQSTDNMQQALSPYHDKCTIRLIAHHCGSAAAARNTGVAHASADYIAFLDADDIFMPTKLATMAEQLKSEPQTLFYSQNYINRGVANWWIKPARGLQKNENIFDYLFIEKGWVHPSSIVLATDLALQNPFDETLSFGDDAQFVASMWLKGINISMIELPLTLYDDPFDAERLSQSPVFKHGESREHQSFMNWVDSIKHEMPETAYRGYRAGFRSRFFAKSAPIKALCDILQAKRHGVLSFYQCSMQTLQTFSPGVYRRIADLQVRIRGVEPTSTRTD